MNHRSAFIAIEGLACVGKTSLLKQLAMRHPEVVVVPEVLPQAERLPVVPWGTLGRVLNVGRYQANDILKSHEVLLHTASRSCAMDRYFVSTLAHRCAELNLSGPDLEISVRSALSELAVLLTPPNAWVYITETPSIAWQRYSELRSSDRSSCWATEAGTTAIAEALECCMKVLSETSAVIRVASDALKTGSIHSLLHRLEEILLPPTST